MGILRQPDVRPTSRWVQRLDKLSITSILKNRHTPDDEIYLKSGRFSCPFCRKNGPSKIFKNLWGLRCHFRFEHGFDVYCEKIISDLESLIKEDVLR